MSDKPTIIDLNKNSLREEAREDYPEDVEDNTESDEGGNVWDESRDEYPEDLDESEQEKSEGNPWDEAREEYPEGFGIRYVQDEDNAPNGAEVREGPKGGKYYIVIKGGFSNYDLMDRIERTNLPNLSSGDTVLINTPLQKAKAGEVVDVSESWTGVTHLIVDTGSHRYDITPFADEHEETYVAEISEVKELNEEIMNQLENIDVSDAYKGDQVMIDVPYAGMVRGTVKKREDTEFGTKLTIHSPPVRFLVYEEPGAHHKKELPKLVGKITKELSKIHKAWGDKNRKRLKDIIEETAKKVHHDELEDKDRIIEEVESIIEEENVGKEGEIMIIHHLEDIMESEDEGELRYAVKGFMDDAMKYTE